jgi:hypothetical protein
MKKTHITILKLLYVVFCRRASFTINHMYQTILDAGFTAVSVFSSQFKREVL